ncbi:MAG: HlyD family efflux transporter periplasmic adaptor subunit [Terriglobia bacterium]
MYAAGVLIVIPVVTLAISRLKPAAPSVERATVWTDTVKRGEMLRQVRGLGTLVPEDIRWIPAATQARVDRIVVRPGAVVQPNTIILELSNPESDRDILDAEWQLKAAEAELANLRVKLESDFLTQRSAMAAIDADYRQAKLQAEVDQKLTSEGLTSELNYERSKVKAEVLSTRLEIEHKRLDIASDAVKAQLAVQQAKVEQLRALYHLRRSQYDSLHVRAGIAGVLQQVPVDVGQQVAPGTNLARVADPKRLKATIKIPEVQAKDVQIGQVAEIDTRNGVVPGRVSRIDPAVQNGTVTVDVSLDGALPQGARPDLSVDGTIEIERLADVLYVGRPVHGQPSSTVGIFKLVEGGKEAVRVQVKLGRSSVSTIEIVDGLKVGDQVVLSDMSNWDSFDRIRLN